MLCTVQKLSGDLLMESLCCAEVLVSLFRFITKKTLFILHSFYAPYSDILASAETPAPQHKDWVTLSAGSRYRLYLFFYPKLAQLWQAQSIITQKHTYALPPPLLRVQMRCFTRFVKCCQHGPISPPSAAVSHQSRFLSALLLIFIFPQNFNYVMPQLSLPLRSLAVQFGFVAMWFLVADLCIVLCARLFESLIFLLKKGRIKAASRRDFPHLLLLFSRWNANTRHGSSALFSFSSFSYSVIFFMFKVLLFALRQE